LGDGKRVTGLETLAVASVFDSQGRFNPTLIPNTESVLDGDTVVLAIGQGSDLSFIRKDDGIEVTPKGTIAVDPQTLATSAPGVFAGGDVVFGPRIIIEAVRDGHTAAMSIDQYLQGRNSRILTRGWMKKASTEELLRPSHLDIPRNRPPTLALDRRVGMTEVELAYDEDMAVEQASRCLRCHIQTVFNGDLCILRLDTEYP
jgi:NADPH-dependent glutamate synthase beta subunit-like oxidoreductase